MSLDVYLTVTVGDPRPPTERIFIRRDGGNVEITREEWDELYPGREPVSFVDDDDGTEVFWANITHNMGRMAGQVGLYQPLWRPDEIGFVEAWQLIQPLRTGLTKMRADKDRLQEFNPENGWGNYDLLLSFTEKYLAACEEHPDAAIRVSR